MKRLEVTIPTMGWEQIGGDADPGSYGGTIASADGSTIELLKIQPVREYVGDSEAADVGFPFWTREASFDASDLSLENDDVKSALQCVGLEEEMLEDMTPTQRVLAIAEALLDYGRADEGPCGWSVDILSVEVKWSDGKIEGASYLADEDEAFRDDVLGYSDIRTKLEETAERMADQSAAQAWSTLGDQALDDIADSGFDADTAVCVAEFGESVAVNGDSTEETMHAVEGKLEADGYEITDYGGRVPCEESIVDRESLIRAVASELKRSEEDVENAGKSLDWWQENIPWGTSGDTSTWAKRKAASVAPQPSDRA